MKSRGIVGALSLMILGAVFGAVLVSNLGMVNTSVAQVKIGAEKAPVIQENTNIDLQSFNNAFINVAEKVTPSIVQITVISNPHSKLDNKFRFFMPFGDEMPEQQGGGSGVIISKDGYIMTNNHVVENATKVTVQLLDKREFKAEVIGTDPLTDLAVIKIDAEDLPAAYLGNSDKLHVGEWVMAIGNPLSLSSTVTAGIVSAMGRNLNIIQNNSGVEYFIQTDAAINPGNSGGALVDLNGSVIGINTAIATNGMSSSYIGYGFAIPINLAKSIAEDLIENGAVKRGYIGVQISDVTPELAKAVGLDKPEGVLVNNIVEDGAAKEAGIQESDIILKIDGHAVNQSNELQNYVARKRAGDTVKLTVYRDEDEITVNVTLKAPDGEETNIAKKDEVKPTKPKEIITKEYEDLGLTVRSLKLNEEEKFEIEGGVMITNVKRYGAAYDQGLAEGLVIAEINKKSITSMDQFINEMESSRGEAVLLKVKSVKGNVRFIGLEIPE